MPTQSFGFDVFGTLVDTDATITPLRVMLGEESRAKRFAELWREKQLEYTFRRAVMRCYENFTVCTEQALAYTATALRAKLSAGQREELMQIHKKLPAFPDVAHGLAQLGGQQHRLAAFSNGVEKSTRALLEHSGLLDRFENVFSVDGLLTYKPDPMVYADLRTRLGSPAEHTWVVSSNPFDVIGAKHAGLRAAWIKRGEHKVYDPWGIEPDLVVPDLPALADHFHAFR